MDASLRNERLAWDTDLDLLKEETVLELELDMEERLTAFRERKMDEVATQLERQLDKREEIMRNKALIDVRRKEARIRAEIEAQLGLKRAEIRDRISGLSKKMDEFKTMAEERMRESITSQIEGEIATDEATLAEREAEMRQLQSQDQRIDKRQQWLASISGQGATAAAPADASALGARPDSLGAAAGRTLRGPMAQAAQAQQPRMGLAGMRAPTSSARALAPRRQRRSSRPSSRSRRPWWLQQRPCNRPSLRLSQRRDCPPTSFPLNPRPTRWTSNPQRLRPPLSRPSARKTTRCLHLWRPLRSPWTLSLRRPTTTWPSPKWKRCYAPVDAIPEAALPTPVATPVKAGGEVFGDRPILQPVRTLHALGTPRPTAVLAGDAGALRRWRNPRAATRHHHDPPSVDAR